ncbi:MAG: HD domain-containing phosphohydrolase [Armatimonadota bacterium]
MSSSAWRDVVGLGLFTTVYFLVNSLGVSRAIAWQRGLAWLAVWREHFLWSGLGFFASASMAAGIRLAFEAMGPRALLLLPLLLLVFYWYQLHQDRLRLSEENARQAREHVEELQRLNEAVLSTLANAIDAKDPYTCSHINRVQIYALALAEAAGVEGPELLAVRTGALVHDIGKLAIPDHILGKPGKLTPEEYARIQTHVQVGAEILSPVPFDFPVIDVVLTHHERWDGLGYPRGLKGDEIPIGGRIISIVDVFDALTSNRPYRRALSHEEALQVLRDGAGKQFDPELVRRFEESLPEARREIARVEAEQQALAAERGADESQHALAQISAASAEMAAVLELSGPLAGARSLETVADLVVRGTLSLLPADTVVLYLKDPVEPHLVAAAAEGKYREKLLGMTVGDGEGVAGAVARDARPRVNVSAAPDVARRFGPDEVQELSAAAAVTLGPPERPLGVLAVYTVAYHVLSEHHLRVLRIISEQAAAAISRLSVRQEPEEESRDEAETSSTFAAR